MNKTKVSTRGQTVIPRAIRTMYNIREGTHIEWVPQTKDTIVVRRPRPGKKMDWQTWVAMVNADRDEFWHGVDPVAYQRGERRDRD